jgi:hypothetical protein
MDGNADEARSGHPNLACPEQARFSWQRSQQQEDYACCSNAPAMVSCTSSPTAGR